MKRADLMKADALSEVLLVSSGVILFLPLLVILIAAFSSSGAIR